MTRQRDPNFFFFNFVMYPTGEFKICFPFVGMTLACIFTLTRYVLIVFKGYFAENLYIFLRLNRKCHEPKNLVISY